MKTSFAQRYGEWAVVTGASSGIGEAFAHALAARGLRPLLIARRPTELQHVAADIRQQHGIACECLALDLADDGFIDTLHDACAGRDVGLVIGNAGVNPAGCFEALSREQLLRVLDVNARANLLLAQAFLPGLRRRGRGGLLLVSSVEACAGMPYSAAYSASKAFVLSLGEALWGETRGSGVDVLTLLPGATDTPLLASRKLGIRGMPARTVADIALDHLGKGPSVVPGALNRWGLRLLRRLPRRWMLRLGATAMRKVLDGMQA